MHVVQQPVLSTPEAHVRCCIGCATRELAFCSCGCFRRGVIPLEGWTPSIAVNCKVSPSSTVTRLARNGQSREAERFGGRILEENFPQCPLNVRMHTLQAEPPTALCMNACGHTQCGR
eukprot:1181898-Prorocentrum_minimum.AAC.3